MGRTIRRPLWIGPLIALLMTGCAQSPAPTPAPPSTTARAAGIHPANIRRVGRELPTGYEVTNIARAASPKAIWGLGNSDANPPQCLALAEPATRRDDSALGVSGSGPGGILDAVVVSSPAGPTGPDRAVVAACPQFDLVAGRTAVRVELIDAPHIDAADTIGMVADIRAAVESGSEIDSRAYTFIAYLGDYYAFTTLTTDPGSMLPPLPSQFAADLLVKTVSTLRG